MRISCLQMVVLVVRVSQEFVLELRVVNFVSFLKFCSIKLTFGNFFLLFFNLTPKLILLNCPAKWILLKTVQYFINQKQLSVFHLTPIFENFRSIYYKTSARIDTFWKSNVTLKKNFLDFFFNCAPDLVGASFLGAPLSAWVGFLNKNLLCNCMCLVNLGCIAYWRQKRLKIMKFVTKLPCG